MYDWVAALLRLRHEDKDLQSSEMQMLFADNDSLVYVRGEHLSRGCVAGRRTVIAISRATHQADLSIPVQETSLAGCHTAKNLLGTATARLSNESLNLTVHISGATVLQLN
jgi:hypothetical protein